MSADNDQLQTAQQDQWEPCADGEISQMVRRLNRSERNKRWRQLATTGLASFVLFAAGAVVAGGFLFYQEPQFGGIGCTECLSHAAEYRDHVTGVSPMGNIDLAARIEVHMSMCACCRAKFHEAYPDVTLAMLGTENPQLRPTRFAFSLAQISPGY